MNKVTWEDIKLLGSKHYKALKKGAEPIDLYRAVGVLDIYALLNLHKLSFRMLTRYLEAFTKGNGRVTKMFLPEFDEDIAKMKHYIMMLEFEEEE